MYILETLIVSAWDEAINDSSRETRFRWSVPSPDSGFLRLEVGMNIWGRIFLTSALGGMIFSGIGMVSYGNEVIQLICKVGISLCAAIAISIVLGFIWRCD
jgi:hypothetical protein